MSFAVFPGIFVPLLPFSLCMESTSYVSPFLVVFFYLVVTGWIFDISLLCENSINQCTNNIICMSIPSTCRLPTNSEC